jgi:TPR repeat protein
LIIGTLYLLGISLNWNPSKGINSFFKGCYHFKNGDSCFILGKIYSKGIWVNENYWKVLKFFRWGCKFHSNFACKELP